MNPIKLIFPILLSALVFHSLCVFAGAINVTRTDLPDHSDVNVEGTIAWALDQAATDGGGTVLLGAGEFQLLDTLEIGNNVSLVGSGSGATRLVPRHSNTVILNASDAKYIALSSLGIDMPNESGSAIRLYEAGLSHIENIDVIQANGGDQNIWMIEIINTNRFRGDSVNIDTHSNGLRIVHGDAEWNMRNYGDSTLTHIDVRLNADHTTGIMLAGSESNLGLINNVSISRVEIARRGGIGGGADGTIGTIGIHLRNTSRCSIIHGDFEGLERPIINEGKIGLGMGGESNAFIHVFSIGGGLPAYTGINDRDTMLIGGDGDFLADMQQRLPRTVSVVDLQGNIFPMPATPLSLEPHSGDYLVKITDNRKVFTNGDATGTVTFTLPEPDASKYLEFTFVSTTPHSIRVTPQANGIIHGINDNPQGIGAGRSVLSAAGRGYAIRLINTNNRRWQVMETTGIWSVDD